MASTLQPPSSQKAGDRPISFLLDNQAGGAPQAFVDLVVRPEELTRVDPSKISVQQTMGGAWADSFGAGLATINISGHTGWRRTASSDDDGIARFLRLKDTVFDEWHAQRAANVERGIDPSEVRLIFSDALDDQSVVVAPMNFVLRRSKSRPLLAQFQISMVVVDAALQNAPYPAQFGYNGVTPANAAEVQSLGLDSLVDAVNTITAQINNLKGMVDASLLGPVRAFMNQTARLYGAVRAAISAASGITASLISAAQMTARAGINLFRTLSAVASLPQLAKAQLMAVASAYSTVFCVLRNAIRGASFVEDYSSLYGASNCSSTAGGRPLSTIAGENPFYKVVPTPGVMPVSFSQPASSALSGLAANDPVLTPMSTSALRVSLSQVMEGMKVAA